MDPIVFLKVIAFAGAIVVGIAALQSLVDELPKRGLDDHVTKVMLALLALGCAIVVLVVFGVLPGIQGPTQGS